MTRLNFHSDGRKEDNVLNKEGLVQRKKPDVFEQFIPLQSCQHILVVITSRELET